MSQKSVKTLRNKADRLFQEWGRLTYEKCLICGRQVSCLHHYFPKSTSTALRYDIDNGIPICMGCHFSLHNSNPHIQNMINVKKGEQWLVDLTYKKYNVQVKPDIQWYKTQIETLKNMIKIYGDK